MNNEKNQIQKYFSNKEEEKIFTDKLKILNLLVKDLSKEIKDIKKELEEHKNIHDPHNILVKER